MTSFFKITGRNKGFTLIEVIIGLVMCSILGAMFVTYTQKNITRSAPIGDDLRRTLHIYSIMERVRLHYQTDQSLSLSTLKANINANAYDDDTTDTYLYNVVYNNYVQCDASSTSTFSTDSSCDPATEDCMLLVVLSDPEQTGIKVTSLFTE